MSFALESIHAAQSAAPSDTMTEQLIPTSWSDVTLRSFLGSNTASHV
jgi:hypothetical protein